MKKRQLITTLFILYSIISFSQSAVNEKLITAARNSNLDLVKEMIKEGGNPNYTKHVGMGMSMRPLTCSAMNSNYEISKILLENGAEIHWKTGPLASPIILATRNNNLKLVKLFIEYGANINDKDIYGGTALLYAQQTKNQELISFVKSEIAKNPIEIKLPKIVNNQKSVEYINIIGTKIFIKPPRDYKQNRLVHGIQKDENNVISIYDNIDQSYYQHAHVYSKESWMSRGGVILQYDEMKFNGFDAKIFALQSYGKDLTAMLLFGDSTFTTMISAKASSKENLNSIIKSLSTIVYDQDHKINLDEVAVFSINNKKTIFKNVDFQSDLFFYSSKKDKKKDVQDSDPMVTISQSFQIPGKIETPKKSMRFMMSSLLEMEVKVPSFDVNSMKAQRLNKYQVLEYVQEGKYKGKPIQIYLFTLVTQKYVIRFQGKATKDFEKNINQFKKLAYSLKIK